MDVILSLLAEAVKGYLLPGTLSLFLIVLTIGLAWWFIRDERDQAVRISLTGLAVGYWLLATPLVAGMLERGLIGDLLPLQEAQSVEVVVVLGGGSDSVVLDGERINLLTPASAERVLEARRVFELMEADWIIASGGPGGDPAVPDSAPLRRGLLGLGVPEAQIMVESKSGDTHDQAVLLAPMLAELQAERFVLVTSATHMRRALLTFEAAGLQPIPSLAVAEEGDSGPVWAPTVSAIQRSQTALREYFAIAYYWLRGWL